MPHKSRMGRPPLPKAERRRSRVTTNLTADEKRLLERLAEAEHLTLSDYLREVLLRHLARMR